MEMIGLQPGAGAPNAPKSIEEAQRKTYQFWDTQPVPKLCKHDVLFVVFMSLFFY